MGNDADNASVAPAHDGAIASGVATRKDSRVLDPLPDDERAVAVSRSAVSRRFVAESAVVVATYLQRLLGELDLRAIAIDEIVFREHTLLIASGATASGEKVILGVHGELDLSPTAGEAGTLRHPDRRVRWGGRGAD